MRLSPALRKEATEHVEKLCQRRGITVRWRPGVAPFAVVEQRRIEVPPIVRASDYLCALHEIGHIASKRARRKNDTAKGADEINVEAAAWAWAAGRAAPEIVAKMSETEWASIGSALISYLRHHALRE